MLNQQLTIEGLELAAHQGWKNKQALETILRRLKIYAGYPGANLIKGKRLSSRIQKRLETWKLGCRTQDGEISIPPGPKKEGRASSKELKKKRDVSSVGPC